MRGTNGVFFYFISETTSLKCKFYILYTTHNVVSLDLMSLSVTVLYRLLVLENHFKNVDIKYVNIVFYGALFEV